MEREPLLLESEVLASLSLPQPKKPTIKPSHLRLIDAGEKIAIVYPGLNLDEVDGGLIIHPGRMAIASERLSGNVYAATS